VREHIGRFGRLLLDEGPDEVLRGLWNAPSFAEGQVAGLHFFPFGGLRKTSQWLRTFDGRKSPGTVDGVVSSA
jgi:methylenetetrahydrofolate reductase (NADPH)